MIIRYDTTTLPGSFSLSHAPALDVARLPFEVHACGHYLAPSAYFTDRTGMDSHLLLYGMEGTGLLELEGKTSLLHPGEAVVFDCMKHQVYRPDTPTWVFRWVHFRGMAAAEYVRRIHGAQPYPVPVSHRASLDGTFQDLFTLFQTKPDLFELEASLLITAMLTELARSGNLSRQEARNPIHREDVERAVQYIEAHWREKIGAGDILSPAHISPWYFSRLFREQTGFSPYEYLVQKRLSMAVQDLLQSNGTVADIATRNGFGDATQFIRRFRRHFGSTPALFRRHVT